MENINGARARQGGSRQSVKTPPDDLVVEIGTLINNIKGTSQQMTALHEQLSRELAKLQRTEEELCGVNLQLESARPTREEPARERSQELASASEPQIVARDQLLQARAPQALTGLESSSSPRLKRGRASSFSHALRPLLEWSGRLDQAVVEFAATHSLLAIRLSLAIIFIWFGLLKNIGPLSAFGLVTDTLRWFPVPPNPLVPSLGIGEIVMGIGLLFGKGLVLRLALLGFLIHMGGTFLVLVVVPEVAFRDGNPFLLTKIGEYVIKNLVFLAAGLALLAGAAAGEKRVKRPQINGD
jgi:putative oxidoreductase